MHSSRVYSLEGIRKNHDLSRRLNLNINQEKTLSPRSFSMSPRMFSAVIILLISNKIGDFCPLNDLKNPRKGKKKFQYTIKNILYFKKKMLEIEQSAKIRLVFFSNYCQI